MPSVRRQLAAVTAVLALSVTGGAVTSPAFADPREIKKEALATGYGGAVSTVDPEASAAAIEVLRDGGNAADAAVAAAATLGVTEPYSAGLGGGGYFVFYDAKTGKVGTIDGRETAPATMPTTAFVNRRREPFTRSQSSSRAASPWASPEHRPHGNGRWSVGHAGP
ncbi:gamma-glutamyltranspeptidase [Arthrobacter sp. Hiyo4]|nr:gamma-glutamyltranspeptidase [Arthrobacter sp. Hiyo4]